VLSELLYMREELEKRRQAEAKTAGGGQGGGSFCVMGVTMVDLFRCVGGSVQVRWWICSGALLQLFRCVGGSVQVRWWICSGAVLRLLLTLGTLQVRGGGSCFAAR
jgi:hypothetical protein